MGRLTKEKGQEVDLGEFPSLGRFVDDSAGGCVDGAGHVGGGGGVSGVEREELVLNTGASLVHVESYNPENELFFHTDNQQVGRDVWFYARDKEETEKRRRDINYGLVGSSGIF